MFTKTRTDFNLTIIGDNKLGRELDKKLLPTKQAIVPTS
jgi:hypothetical protein